MLVNFNLGSELLLLLVLTYYEETIIYITFKTC